MGKVSKAIQNPGQALGFMWGRLNGIRYKCWYGMTNRRVSIGKSFSVQGKLLIKGPGRVVIGDNVIVNGVGHPVTPFTHDKDAVISIGSHCFLNGTRFGCQKEIMVSDRAILADCRIMDTDFHSVRKDRWSKQAPVESAAIRIEKNVWVSAGSAVLKGVTIGENSVVGYGAVVTSSIPADSIAAGNPAKVLAKVPEVGSE